MTVSATNNIIDEEITSYNGHTAESSRNNVFNTKEFVDQVADSLATLIAEKRTNKTILEAVIEVKIYSIHTSEIRHLHSKN